MSGGGPLARRGRDARPQDAGYVQLVIEPFLRAIGIEMKPIVSREPVQLLHQEHELLQLGLAERRLAP